MTFQLVYTTLALWLGFSCASTDPVQQAMKPISPLPPQLNECSGLVQLDGDLYVGLNDSGNPAELYVFNLKKKHATRVVRVLGAGNYDWEELTADDTFLYIGDMGNNSGNRRDLVIYRVLKADVQTSDDVRSEKITFEYPEQKKFEPSNKHNFDCEAMVSLGDSLYLFTKNRGNERTDMYAIPKKIGHHQAVRLDQFDAGGLITGAALRSSGQENQLALIGYTVKDKGYHPFIYVFSPVSGTKLFNTPVGHIQFDNTLQTETVMFAGPRQLTITNEEEHHDEGYLYAIDLTDLPEIR